MPALFKNNASALIASSLTTSDTTIVLSAGLGNSFPSPTGSSYFYGTLFDDLGNYEIVKCTARTTDTLTVTRGQDGTNPLEFTAGAGFALRPVAAMFNNFVQLDGNNTFSGNNIFSGNNTFSGTGNSFNVGANFKILQVGSNLVFQYNGVAKFAISSTGELIAVDNITAYGTI